MKITLPKKNKILLLGIMSLLAINLSAQEEVPFNCDYNAYLFQYNDVYAIDLASGNSVLIAADITTGNINAAGYNPKDGYIWAYLSSPDKSIVRIGKNFTSTVFAIDELDTGNKYVGDVRSDGMYFLKAGGTTYYKIDLDPDSANYTKYVGSFELSKSISVHDWAFNSVDDKLYTVEQKTNILYRIDPDTGVVQSLGEVPIISGKTYTYGAVYFDLSGRFYISANQTGTVYVISDVQDLDGTNNITSNIFAYGPASSSNDGARCPTAPVAQEICDNGIDDDGDGLIDCDDPSCSGYGTCPVLGEVSGGNEGGLESNNRLSEQINKRNYNRVKTTYKFDETTAKRVEKSSKYAKKSATTTLKDFIPFGVISENEVIESTPEDLLGITNATEVYSVDYLRDSKKVASILSLKTENGVYEHTKYICDRLLGAQIISISTLEINEEPFIKTIIKNADGTMEYVLSLSAKETNSGVNYGVECHWNLDKYEQDTSFYNFQIWANTIDDLYSLGEELITLVDAQKTISSYEISTPPTVFVRSGEYINGTLDLQIVNTNATQEVNLDAGMRETETSTEENLNTDISLDTAYISNIVVDTGNLFDIGLRIGDGIATPDDLFMSDGPWGVDDAAASTVVSNYTILPNENSFDAEVYPVERNLNLTATTSEYIAAYRALTPRFQAVDLSSYKSFHLKAKGTGIVEITFVKSSIDDWEEQYKTTIELTSDMTDFTIPFTTFSSTLGTELVLDDIKTIVYKMTSSDGVSTTKEMTIEDVWFSKTTTLSVETVSVIGNKMSIVPNPVDTTAKIYFTLSSPQSLAFEIYNSLGNKVKQMSFEAQIGENEMTFNKESLSSGLYFVVVKSNKGQFETTKMLIK